MRIVKGLAFITIVALPAYLIRCKDYSWCVSPIPFTLLEVLILTTFSSWVIWLVYLVRSRKESLSKLFERVRGPLIIPIAFFILAATISLLTTPDLRGGLGIWKAYFIEGFLLYLVVVDLSLRRKDYFWVLKALVLSGLLVSLSSFFRFFQFVGEFGLDETLNLRIFGPFEFANAIPLYLGPIVALSVSVIASQFRSLTGRSIFYISILSLLVMLAAIFLSGSKGGLVGVFSILVVWVGFLVFKSLSTKFKKYFRYLLFILIGLYFLLSIFVYSNIDNLVPEGRYKSNSVDNRYCIWQGTRNMLNDDPITGSGLNGFHLEYENYKTCLKADYQYPHNILLTFWSEMGLLGLASLLWLTYAYLKTNSNGKDEILSIGLSSALVYIWVHGLVDVPFFKNDLSAEFWLLVALVSANYKLKD